MNTVGQYTNLNTILGSGAMTNQIDNGFGFDNTAFGNNALVILTPGERESTAFGSQALLTSTVGENSAFGAHAGAYIDVATRNALFGNWAGRYVSGNDNTAQGYRAMAGDNNLNNFPTITGGISTGDRNTATGASSMRYAPSGDDNTAHGFNALGLINGGSDNTAQGSGALGHVTNGTSNTAQGMNAGASITSGTNNTLLGDGADTSGPNAAIAIQRTAIGAGAVASTDNTIILGSTESVGVGTTTPDSRLHVVSAALNVPAIHGASSNGGAAVLANGTTGSTGVQATSDSGSAVTATSVNGVGVVASSSNSDAIQGTAVSGTAVNAKCTGSGVAVAATATGTGNGLVATAVSGNAIVATNTGTGNAITASTSGTSGYAMRANASAGTLGGIYATSVSTVGSDTPALTVNGSHVDKVVYSNGSYTASADDYIIMINTSGGASTVTLPAPATLLNGHTYIVSCIGAASTLTFASTTAVGTEFYYQGTSATIPTFGSVAGDSLTLVKYTNAGVSTYYAISRMF